MTHREADEGHWPQAGHTPFPLRVRKSHVLLSFPVSFLFKQALKYASALVHPRRGNTSSLALSSAITPPCRRRALQALGGEACELLLAEVSCALLWASFGFPALLVRERQNRCDMVYVLARLFICHSLAIILDLQKILWYEGRLWAAASQLSRTDCPQ